MKALVVDDSRSMRAIIGSMLKELDFDVIEAIHGKDALEKLNASEAVPDIALLDWNMPEMNGYELVCALRQNTRFNGLLILMVTTETEMSQMVKALQAGANEYMMKPFTREILADKLRMMGFQGQSKAA